MNGLMIQTWGIVAAATMLGIAAPALAGTEICTDITGDGIVDGFDLGVLAGVLDRRHALHALSAAGPG